MSKQDFPFKDSVNLFDVAAACANNLKVLLYCEPDKDKYDTKVIHSIANSAGVTVIQVCSTAECLAKFSELSVVGHSYEKHFRVLTNNARWEDAEGHPIEPSKSGERRPAKGLLLCKKLRALQYMGPILVYCGDASLALDALAKETHAMVTVSSGVAERYVSFQPMCPMLLELYPCYSSLEASCMEHRDVTATEVYDALLTLCKKKGKPPPVRPEDPAKVLYRKWYIPKASVSLENKTYPSQLFHMVEDLVYRQCKADHDAPVIKRLIVIENEMLRSRFDAALKALEGSEADCSWVDADVADQRFLNVLRMMVADNPAYPRAKPTLLFHATNDLAEKPILAEGFSMNFLGASTNNEGWYGKGYYMTSFPTYARWYMPQRGNPNQEGSICFIISWCLLGKTHVQRTIDVGKECVAGCHTHYAITNRTRPIDEKPPHIYPDGDEIVCFHEDYSLPLFVVEMGK